PAQPARDRTDDGPRERVQLLYVTLRLPSNEEAASPVEGKAGHPEPDIAQHGALEGAACGRKPVQVSRQVAGRVQVSLRIEGEPDGSGSERQKRVEPRCEVGDRIAGAGYPGGTGVLGRRGGDIQRQDACGHQSITSAPSQYRRGGIIPSVGRLSIVSTMVRGR